VSLLSISFHAALSLDLFFDPQDEGNAFLGNTARIPTGYKELDPGR
jgi:hypothetical protein